MHDICCSQIMYVLQTCVLIESMFYVNVVLKLK